MVLAAAALWGTTGTAQAIAGGELSSVWFGALRLAVAAAFFAAYAGLLAHRERAVAGKLRASSVLTAGVSMAAYNLAFFAGVRDTGVAVGTAIALGSGPLWAGLLQSVIARQRPRAIWWLGTVLAVAGGVLLSTGAGQTNASIGMRGVLLCLLSGLSYAVYTLTNKRMVASAPASRVTLYAFTTAAALALPAAWLDSGVPVLRVTDTLAVAYVGVVTAGVSYLLFSHALRHISAGTAVTLALGEPVVAFALAVVVVGEQPSAFGVAGLLLVIAGVVVVVRHELRQGLTRPTSARARLRSSCG
jgi:DME family drug/metabolite transporter